ncbi:hypothetical protein Leryth_021135 [Lithospermum erythrorhizon]|nr:hypothetical protein Leryth_021135 [Lithospermum erythrorhizon]
MDPCPFVRLIIESLALKLPLVTKPAGSAGVHPSTTPCYVKLKLNNFPTQTSLIPLSTTMSTDLSPPQTTTNSTTFHLEPTTLNRLFG